MGHQLVLVRSALTTADGERTTALNKSDSLLCSAVLRTHQPLVKAQNAAFFCGFICDDLFWVLGLCPLSLDFVPLPEIFGTDYTWLTPVQRE